VRYNGFMTTLNERAWQLCDEMVAEADQLGVAVITLECGTRVIDCGVKAPGSVDAGLRLANVCMSGLGTAVQSESESNDWPGPRVITYVSSPVEACMASQYAGWEIKADNFFGMGSGPMRAAACREELFQHIGHCERPDVCVGVIETGKIPPVAVCRDIAEKCGITPDRLTLLVARTSSQAGTVQIVARSVETALHKLHQLGFDLERIESAQGTAPLPPVASDDLTAIGWTNDAILYGALVILYVRGDSESIAKIGPRIPSDASPDYGRPFSEIFKRYGGDFYRIDPLLFSPARIMFHIEGTDQTPAFGRIAPEILAESFANK
jgi:methenyltetrahydromethanopterin cyclohydrolase